MTTVVSNSSGRQGGKTVRKNQSSNASHSAGDHITQKDNEKFQPTAEQMRIASLMTDKRDADSDLKPKIDQIVELTGATRDDAAIALYDCDNDMDKAVEMILDGEALESEWQSTGKKKKQKQPAGSAPTGLVLDQSSAGASLNGQKTGDDRKFDKSRRDRNNALEENGSSVGGADYKNSENGRPMRVGKRDGSFKPRGDRRGGGFAGASSGGYSRDSEQVPDGGASGDDDRSYAQTGDGSRRGGFGGRGGRGGAFVGRGRGAPRGGRGGRGGARTFSTRPQGTDKPSDEFLGSIDTWTNEPKPDESGVNTMKVGNWSDFNGQEWSSDNWNESMENKAFNSSEKAGPAAASTVPDVPKPVVPNPPTQMSFLSAASKSIEKESQQQAQQQTQQQPQPAPTPSSNFSSVASSVPSKRPEPSPQQSAQPQAAPQQATSQPSQQQTQSQTSQQQQTQVTAGRALLNQIQQPQQQQPAPQQAAQQQAQQQQPSPQQPTLKPVHPPQNAAPGLGINIIYNKNATESIKSLVGLSASAIGEPLSGDISKQMSTNTRINAPSQQTRAKPAESAVEMPTNDVHNISLRFGSLDFNSSASGTSTQPSFSTLPQESIFEAPANQKPEKNLNALIEQAAVPANSSTGGYRSNAQTSAQKNVIPVLSDVLNSEKISGSNNYSSSAPKKNDYMMGGYGKNSSYNTSSDNYNNSSYYQPQQQPNFPHNYYNPAASQFNSGSLMQTGTFNSGSTYGGNTASVPVAQQQQAVKDNQQSQSNVPVGSAPTSSAPNTLGLMSNSTNTTNVLKTALPATGKGVHNNNSSNPSMPPGVQGFAQHSMVHGSYLTTNNGVPVPYMPFPAYQGMADPFRTESFNNYPSADMKFNRGSEADMNTGSSQTVQSMAPGQGAHNQYPLNMGPSMANMSPFGYFPSLYGHHYLNPQQFNTHSYSMPATTNSHPTSFASKNNAAYGSNTHSYNSAYDNLGSAGSANVGAASANATGVTGTQNADYIKPGGYGSQQIPHNKSLQSSGSASELSASNQGNTNGQQPMYNKSHSQITKQNFEKQNPYQPNNQFNMGNNGLGGYGSQSNYLLTQHLGSDQSAAGGPQAGGSNPGQRGSMKGNPGGQSGQGYGAKIWN